MKKDKVHIDQLFEEAKNSAPKISLDGIQTMLDQKQFKITSQKQLSKNLIKSNKNIIMTITTAVAVTISVPFLLGKPQPVSTKKVEESSSFHLIEKNNNKIKLIVEDDESKYENLIYNSNKREKENLIVLEGDRTIAFGENFLLDEIKEKNLIGNNEGNKYPIVEIKEEDVDLGLLPEIDLTIEKEREVKEFTKLSVSTGIDVILTQDDNYTLKVKCDEALYDDVKTVVKNGELKIYYKEKLKSISFGENGLGVKVYVSAKKLESIRAQASATVTCKENFKSTKLEINASAASEIEMKELTVNKLTINANSSSEVDVNFKSDNITINTSTASECELSGEANTTSIEASSSSLVDLQIMTDKITVNASTASECELSGAANSATIEASSSSEIDADELTLKTCTLEASTMSDVSVNVSKSLKIEANSSSEVKYEGNAAVEKSVSTGAEVKKK